MSNERASVPLPDDLPELEDNGAADHLTGSRIPAELRLQATDGTSVDLSSIPGRVVVYCYPKTGRPDEVVIPEGWNDIPGARGCTPEACGFRDHYQELQARDVTAVFGLSLQSSDYQREARDRLGLPFELVSDSDRRFTRRLVLPTFEVADELFLKRLTLIIGDGRIEQVFYPVFPPDEHSREVIRWVETHPLD